MNITPNQNEKTFSKDVLLVTKTDKQGKITYANRSFLKIVMMSEEELIGQPHNIIRHPDMPKIIFKYLWQYLKFGTEVHAYVKNICADGSFYWVLANVTPSYSRVKSVEKIIGFHSSRRQASLTALEVIVPLYKKLLDAEALGGINESEKIISAILHDKGMDYEEYILSI
ncbi:PAS domain S-box protein [Sulfurimonas sp. SAG-AH-194-I05]|nr:PAS domain S-box protein [Sulfurimonas sp. SAG-AH-194-I05]MDF1874939.1 PAS domain S-box protein [Sulfurimonas sp. SAG-AH-194-I05]